MFMFIKINEIIEPNLYLNVFLIFHNHLCHNSVYLYSYQLWKRNIRLDITS